MKKLIRILDIISYTMMVYFFSYFAIKGIDSVFKTNIYQYFKYIDDILSYVLVAWFFVLCFTATHYFRITQKIEDVMSKEKTLNELIEQCDRKIEEVKTLNEISMVSITFHKDKQK